MFLLEWIPSNSCEGLLEVHATKVLNNVINVGGMLMMSYVCYKLVMSFTGLKLNFAISMYMRITFHVGSTDGFHYPVLEGVTRGYMGLLYSLFSHILF